MTWQLETQTTEWKCSNASLPFNTKSVLLIDDLKWFAWLFIMSLLNGYSSAQIWFVLLGELWEETPLTSLRLKLTERAFARTHSCKTSWHQVQLSCCCLQYWELLTAFMEIVLVSCLHSGWGMGHLRCSIISLWCHYFFFYLSLTEKCNIRGLPEE